jgi:hypothetical protein
MMKYIIMIVIIIIIISCDPDRLACILMDSDG